MDQESQNRKDKAKTNFFGTSNIEDIDTMFYNLLLQKSEMPTPLRLINKYDSSLIPEIKEILINYIITSFNESIDETCGDPTILIEALTESNDLYDKIVDVLEILSKKAECRSLFVYLIYYTSHLISKQHIKMDNLKYYGVLKFLCGIKENKKIFEDKKFWGLLTMPKFEANLSQKHFIYLRSSTQPLIDGKKIMIENYIKERHELYNDTKEWFDIFKYKKSFMPYESHNQNTLFPCFLEGALVPFFYNRDKYCRMLYGKTPVEIRQSLDLVITDIKFIQSSLHSLLFNLVKDNEKIRINFIDFIREFYSINKERRKIMFDEKSFISDGVAFNFCNILDAFCDKMVSKKMLDKIDFEYFNRVIRIEDEDDNEKDHIIDPKCNVFCTTMLTYRVLFTEISYSKMFEEKRSLSNQIEYTENQRIKLALESRLNVFRTILFSDFFLQQDLFLEYMVDCIIHKENFENYDKKLFFDPLFYKIMVEFKHHNMICYYGTISNNVYLIMQKMLFSDINIHEKEKIIIIMYEEKWEITEELFLKLCDIYDKAGKLTLLDRFTIRAYINLIIQNDRNKYITNLKKNGINFVSGAIQDLEMLLSTGVDAIVNIKKLGKAIKDFEGKNTDYKENEEYKKLVEKHNDHEKKAKGAFSHIDKAFEIIHYILINNINLFLYNEVKFLLVNTLNYNMKVLVGPKCSSLTVENMKKYNFKPRELLGLLCSIYSEIRTNDLRKAIVDSKDFNFHFFKRALNIIKDREILDVTQLEKYEAFVKNIEKISDMNEEKEEKTYPDDFLDPLTFEVMRNPVKLLTSNVTIDKSTFDLIMVSNGVDPFCREPLDKDKFVYNEELKKRIEDFEKE